MWPDWLTPGLVNTYFVAYIIETRTVHSTVLHCTNLYNNISTPPPSPQHNTGLGRVQAQLSRRIRIFKSKLLLRHQNCAFCSSDSWHLNFPQKNAEIKIIRLHWFHLFATLINTVIRKIEFNLYFDWQKVLLWYCVELELEHCDTTDTVSPPLLLTASHSAQLSPHQEAAQVYKLSHIAPLPPSLPPHIKLN